MSTSARPSVPAYVLARGFGFALAGLALELALTWSTPRLEDALAIEPLAFGPFVSGALLRLAISILTFSAIAWFVAESSSRLVRGAAVLVAGGILFAEATSYRWLGEHGELLSFRSSLFAADAFTGRSGALALAWAIGATLLGAALAAFLEPRLEQRYATPRAAAVDVVLLVVAFLFGSATVWLGGSSLRLGATPPMVGWLLENHTDRLPTPSAPEREFDDLGVRLPPGEILDTLVSTLFPRAPGELSDRAHPYCREARPLARPERARSVVLLDLRGVPRSAIEGDAPKLPTLARLAREGVSFEHAISGSDSPTSGLVELLSGIPPLAPLRYDELPVLPRLPSLPETLGDLGLHTSFVSSFDLSAGLERTYLRRLGFDSLDEPSFAAEAARGATSGSDAATIDALITRLGATRERGPRFVVATLEGGFGLTIPSAPAPDAGLPPEAGIATDAGVADAGATAPTVAPASAAYASLERELARFVSWFEANERANGTVLVITSDSAPEVPDAADLSRMRFDVPLVFSNLHTDERNRGRARAESLVGLLDVADTVLGLEDLGPVGCFQGRDLLASGEPLPRRRRLISYGGPDQSHVYVFDGRMRWQIDRASLEGAFQVFDTAEDAALEHDLYDEADPLVPFVRDQILATLALGQYLAAHDRFVPGTRTDPTRVAASSPASRQLAPLATSSAAALASSLTARKANGFDGFVVPVAIDGTTLAPVVAGRPLADVLASLVRPLGSLPLALDVAMPEDVDAARSLDAARQLVLTIEASALTANTVVMARDPQMARSIAARSALPVYVRLPGGRDDLVGIAEGFGVAGVVLQSPVASETVTRAHVRGLRVAVDEVASIDAIGGAGGELPDYIFVTSNAPLQLR